MSDRGRERTGWVILCFAIIYLVWGSTYLAIRFVVEEVPPLLMSGTRFVVAGLALWAVAGLRGAGRSSLAAWGASALTGTLMFGGNVLLGWAETRVPSGLAALMLATIPLWMAGLDSLRKDAPRLAPRQKAGIAVGVAGMVVLVGPAQLLGAGALDPLATAALVGSALTWSVGSLLSRQWPQPVDPVAAAGLPMVSGGAVLLASSLLAGDGAVALGNGVSAKAALSWVYLVVLGSLIGFSAYSWLLRRVPAALVSTYAFVNPVVALAVGWALVGERLTGRGVLASVLILAAVAAIVIPRRPPRPELAAAEKRHPSPPGRLTGSSEADDSQRMASCGPIEERARTLFGEQAQAAMRELDRYQGSVAASRERVQKAILQLTDGSIENLRRWVEVALGDYREVLGPAEYPDAGTAEAVRRFNAWRPDAATLAETSFDGLVEDDPGPGD